VQTEAKKTEAKKTKDDDDDGDDYDEYEDDFEVCRHTSYYICTLFASVFHVCKNVVKIFSHELNIVFYLFSAAVAYKRVMQTV